MIIKQIVSVTLAFSLATSLYGAESKPKKQTKTSAKSSKEQVKNTTKIDENEFEVSKSEIMPKVTPPVIRDDKTETVYDPTTKLMWQDNKEAKTVYKLWLTQENYDMEKFDDTSGDTAATYCKNLRLGGYSDWRLPEIKELLSITDMTRYSPAIKSGFQNVYTDYYWSSSTINSNRAWYVDFRRGGDHTNGKDSNLFVRCVRSSN